MNKNTITYKVSAHIKNVGAKNYIPTTFNLNAESKAECESIANQMFVAMKGLGIDYLVSSIKIEETKVIDGMGLNKDMVKCVNHIYAHPMYRRSLKNIATSLVEENIDTIYFQEGNPHFDYVFFKEDGYSVEKLMKALFDNGGCGNRELATIIYFVNPHFVNNEITLSKI